MFIERQIASEIQTRLNDSNKIVVLYGARQVGKTTLVNRLVEQLEHRTLIVNGDDIRFTGALSSRNLTTLRNLVTGYDLLVVDEAQRIPEIGINLKLLHDNIPDLRIIATGSSSFELANRVAEPLTGRTWTYLLYPVGFSELFLERNRFELDTQLESRLVYGSYPEVLILDSDEDREALLREICASYLYQDILQLTGIRNRAKIADLLRLLAYQVGAEVSLDELSRTIGLSRDTVDTYIDLLEKSFVVFRLGGYSRKLRKEVVRSRKIYFYDLGVRNTLIQDLKHVPVRGDVGQLWENFLIVERMKTKDYSRAPINRYFWRTYTGAEIDYVEESGGELAGFEFTHGTKRKRPPRTWQDTYPGARWTLVNRENYLDFVLGERSSATAAEGLRR